MKNKAEKIPPVTVSEDLLSVNQWVYEPCGLKISRPMAEPESSEYGACEFQLNRFAVKFRRAKITPTKTGQFVTLWKRIADGPIQPFDTSDSIDFFIVSVRDQQHFGQFIFPMTELRKQGVISHKHTGGKRAIRVYPPWDATTSGLAKKSQKWQLEYFLNLSDLNSIDIERAKGLLRLST